MVACISHISSVPKFTVYVVVMVTNHRLCVSAAPVRAELMTQLPHIAMLCHEDKNRLHYLVLDHLLPLVVEHLADDDSLVRISVSTFMDHA
jgi:hypothetical protein